MKTTVRTLVLSLSALACFAAFNAAAAEAPVARITVVGKRLPRAEAPIERIVVVGHRETSTRIAQAAAANRRVL